MSEFSSADVIHQALRDLRIAFAQAQEPLAFSALQRLIDLDALDLNLSLRPEGFSEDLPLLLAAAELGWPRLISLMAPLGFNLSVTNVFGHTAAHRALVIQDESTRIATLSALIRAGAPLNLREGESGHTPLHFAAMHCFKSVQLLLDSGADPLLRDLYDQTPLMIAIDHAQLESFDLLLSAHKSSFALDPDFALKETAAAFSAGHFQWGIRLFQLIPQPSAPHPTSFFDAFWRCLFSEPQPPVSVLDWQTAIRFLGALPIADFERTVLAFGDALSRHPHLGAPARQWMLQSWGEPRTLIALAMASGRSKLSCHTSRQWAQEALALAESLYLKSTSLESTAPDRSRSASL